MIFSILDPKIFKRIDHLSMVQSIVGWTNWDERSTHFPDLKIPYSNQGWLILTLIGEFAK